MAKKSNNKVPGGQKPTNIEKQLVKRTNNISRKIESVMGKSAKTESFAIEDDLIMYLYDGGDNRNKYIRLDFNDYTNCDKFYMIMNRAKLKEMADFILKYLEQN